MAKTTAHEFCCVKVKTFPPAPRHTFWRVCECSVFIEVICCDECFPISNSTTSVLPLYFNSLQFRSVPLHFHSLRNLHVRFLFMSSIWKFVIWTLNTQTLNDGILPLSTFSSASFQLHWSLFYAHFQLFKNQLLCIQMGERGRDRFESWKFFSCSLTSVSFSYLHFAYYSVKWNPKIHSFFAMKNRLIVSIA